MVCSLKCESQFQALQAYEPEHPRLCPGTAEAEPSGCRPEGPRAAALTAQGRNPRRAMRILGSESHVQAEDHHLAGGMFGARGAGRWHGAQRGAGAGPHAAESSSLRPLCLRYNIRGRVQHPAEHHREAPRRGVLTPGPLGRVNPEALTWGAPPGSAVMDGSCGHGSRGLCSSSSASVGTGAIVTSREKCSPVSSGLSAAPRPRPSGRCRAFSPRPGAGDPGRVCSHETSCGIRQAWHVSRIASTLSC